jgi:hypothetical protein
MSGVKNIDVQIEGDILTLKVDLSKELGISQSGASMLIATTSGVRNLLGAPGVKWTLNVFAP